MTELEFHQKAMNILPKVISGVEAESKLYDLLMRSNQHANANYNAINTLLDARNDNNELLKFFQRMFDDSSKFLVNAGYDPFPISKEELKAFKKEYPDPYRWRIPAWIREPVINLFTKNKN